MTARRPRFLAILPMLPMDLQDPGPLDHRRRRDAIARLQDVERERAPVEGAVGSSKQEDAGPGATLAAAPSAHVRELLQLLPRRSNLALSIDVATFFSTFA